MSGVDDFRVVTRRRRNPRSLRAGVHRLANEKPEDSKEIESHIDPEQVLRRLSEAVEEIKDNGYGKILLEGLDKGLSLIAASDLPEIICYGLGNFSQTKASRYQLAAILTVKSHYQSKVVLYDPLFFNAEIEILKKLGLRPLESNEEAKRPVGERPSLIYMPHCPHQLTNNFIYANWSFEQLANCIVLSNSFGDVVDSIFLKDIKRSTNYLTRVHPYTTEVKLDNAFSHEEVFNGSAIHIFRRENLARVPIDFWQDREEPIYQENCEFVRQSQAKELTSQDTQTREINNKENGYDE